MPCHGCLGLGFRVRGCYEFVQGVQGGLGELLDKLGQQGSK